MKCDDSPSKMTGKCRKGPMSHDDLTVNGRFQDRPLLVGVRRNATRRTRVLIGRHDIMRNRDTAMLWFRTFGLDDHGRSAAHRSDADVFPGNTEVDQPACHILGTTPAELLVRGIRTNLVGVTRDDHPQSEPWIGVDAATAPSRRHGIGEHLLSGLREAGRSRAKIDLIRVTVGQGQKGRRRSALVGASDDTRQAHNCTQSCQ